MDVVALAQLGFPNAVATLGTACTTDHVQKLFRFTDSVVFSFDGDSAGRRAARKALDGAIPFATDVRNVKFLFLPAEHDPDSFIREFGKEAFSRYVSEATPLSRFLIDAAREGCDLNTMEGRSRLASNANPLWSAMPEGALKRQLLGEIADLVQLSTRELTDIWDRTQLLLRNCHLANRNTQIATTVVKAATTVVTTTIQTANRIISKADSSMRKPTTLMAARLRAIHRKKITITIIVAQATNTPARGSFQALNLVQNSTQRWAYPACMAACSLRGVQTMRLGCCSARRACGTPCRTTTTPCFANSQRLRERCLYG
jgi:DNA primase